MEVYNAKRIVSISEDVVSCHFIAMGTASRSDELLKDEEASEAANRVRQISAEAEHLGLPMTKIQADRTVSYLESGRSGDRLTSLLEDLNQRFTDETSQLFFFFVPQERLKQFGDARDLMGEEAFEAFPSCRDEIAEAGRCYAVGQFTASVFHLMRALEPILELISSSLGITDSLNSWNQYLDQIGAAARRNFPKSSDPDRIFYSGAEAHLRGIKDAWRNTTMHSIAARYDEREAKDLSHHVCSLLRFLSTNLSEAT